MKPLKDDRYIRLVPTLDGDGWIRHGNKDKIDRLLAHFFTTDAGQTSMYYGAIGTYQSISANNSSDLGMFRDTLERYLITYIGKHIENYKVDVYVTDLSGNIKDNHELDGEAAVGIKLVIEFVDNNEYVIFEKDLRYEKGVFSYVLDKFNRGI